MVSLVYAPEFIRKFKKLPKTLREEASERLEDFRAIKNHQWLKVHKLHGSMNGLCAFSVNYTYRIVFEWSKDKRTAHILNIGDHSVYE